MDRAPEFGTTLSMDFILGVGIVKGDSERYGPGRYWIVVIYGVIRSGE